ncbi:O-methyltransferase [Actinoplanes xinjiangensis]|uniref:O-methyltransferase n=2 Tax=Actinoplanes xinjiangensis TaxID=512350 RepID=A0A316EUR6_9ACTN|nr:O-methyltransferase [Actinoplanes xinjiangensis]
MLDQLREYMLGPTRFMNVLSCFELGIIDELRRNPGSTAVELGAVVGARPDAVEQLLHLPVKDGLVAYDVETGTYLLDGLAAVGDEDLHRVLAIMNATKMVVLRQSFYLTESVRTATTVGLKTLYGHDGNLYEALEEHRDLRDAWATMMDTVTAHIDPWFFDNIDIPPGSKVLDLAGNTGLGAILAYRLTSAPNVHVTTFDLPEKQAECLMNFKAADLEQHCSFIGGDAFHAVPKGFDVVLIKHFVDMFDKNQVLTVLRNAYQALNPGGTLHILGPVYSENLEESYGADFFPTYFLGCTMGQGGPQKLSTYRRWLQSCGFSVTKAIAQDLAEMPADALVAHGILSATKFA